MRELSAKEMARVAGGGDTITVTGTPLDPWPTTPIFFFNMDMSVPYHEVATMDPDEIGDQCASMPALENEDGTTIAFESGLAGDVLADFFRAAQEHGGDITVQIGDHSVALSDLMDSLGFVAVTFDTLPPGSLGEYRPSSQDAGTIVIDPGQTGFGDQFLVTFLHEMIHASDYQGHASGTYDFAPGYATGTPFDGHNATHDHPELVAALKAAAEAAGDPIDGQDADGEGGSCSAY